MLRSGQAGGSRWLGHLKSLTAASIDSFGEIYDFAVFDFSVTIVAKHFFLNSDPTVGILSIIADYAPNMKGMRHHQSLFSRPRTILQPRKIV
jgi:hypothetical protein